MDAQEDLSKSLLLFRRVGCYKTCPWISYWTTSAVSMYIYPVDVMDGFLFTKAVIRGCELHWGYEVLVTVVCDT